MCQQIYLKCLLLFFLIIRRPPRSTPPDTLFPYTTLFRSCSISATSWPITRPFSTPKALPRRPITKSFWKWPARPPRSEEHTSELQSLMRILYAVFCLKKKQKKNSIKAHSYPHQTNNESTILQTLSDVQSIQ